MWLEFLISFMLAASCAPLAFFQAACPCCVTPCAICTGSTPGSIQVDIAGIANDVCGDCTSLDGTYIVTGPTIVTGCEWNVSFSTICTANQLNVTLFTTNIRASLRAAATPLDPIVLWNGIPAGYDTCTWTNLSIPFLFDKDCDGTAATCLLTAL